MCEIVTKQNEVVTSLNDEEDSAFCLSPEIHLRSDSFESDSETTLDIDLTSEGSSTSVNYEFNDGLDTLAYLDSSDSEKAEEDSPSHPSTLICDLKKGPAKSSLKSKQNIEDESEAVPQKLKEKRTIMFDRVTVFYFPRKQGFTCVPCEGGATLGMSAQHSQVKEFSIEEHAIERRKIHLTKTKTDQNDIDSEDKCNDSSETELDSRYSLVTVPPKMRRNLLRAAGVRRIHAFEEYECENLRYFRQNCGCECEDSCDPRTCFCSKAGIQCQVDESNFPCVCTIDNCGNLSGRSHFNGDLVRTHFQDTLMKMKMEKTQEDNLQEKSEDLIASINNESY